MISMQHRISRIKLHTLLIAGSLPLVCLCFSLLLMLPGPVSAVEGSKPAFGNVDAELLEGSWIRSDGGYVLELSNIANDGTLTAAYFNPQPIRVFQAFWATDEGTLAVFIELRDINYPGSKYSLRYDPAADALRGIYFQALEQQRYEIEFIRHR